MYVMDFTRWILHSEKQRHFEDITDHFLFQDLVSYRKILCLTTRFKLQMFTFDVSSQDSLCTSIQLSPVSKLYIPSRINTQMLLVLLLFWAK